jgi:hypothetical protein
MEHQNEKAVRGRKRKHEDEQMFERYMKLQSDRMECGLCDRSLEGTKLSNFKRHFCAKHPTQAAKLGVFIEPRPKKFYSMSVESSQTATAVGSPLVKKTKISPGALVRRVLGFVINNNLSFRTLNDENFRFLNNLNEEATGLTINSQTTERYMMKASAELKNDLIEEMENRLLSVKLDIATRNGRSYLGVNVQFYSYVEAKIVVRTISVIEMKDKHTARHIHDQLSNVLLEYGISKTQIIMCVTDNGANVVACSRRLAQDQNTMLLNEAIEEMRMQNSHDVQTDEELPLVIRDALNSIFSLAVVGRCSIHTLQLAVLAALKKITPESQKLISAVRSAVKSLKSTSFDKQTSELGIKKVPIDCLTRWNSTDT